jgi:hypothetical protein
MEEWHPWIKKFRKGEAIVAELDEAAILSRVSTLSPEEVDRLRNIAPDNHNSFPGFNLNCPLLDVSDGALWDQPDVLWELALRATLESPLAYRAQDLHRVGRLLGDFPLREVAPRLGSEGPKLASMISLLERLAAAKPKAELFLHQLAMAVVAAVEQGRIPKETGIALLYGRGSKKKRRLESWSIALILEVANVDQFAYRVADPVVPAEWSRLLLASDSAPPQGSPDFVCAISGRPDSPLGLKMPEPTLPMLGKTYLMAMNAASPCQTRYGRTSMEIFRAGKCTVQSLSDALTLVTAQSRRGKTWAGVPSGSRKWNDLLIAYLEEEPESDLALAGLFADMDPDSGDHLAGYEARTAHIHDALRLREKAGRDLHVTVLALGKINDGIKQVLFSGRYTAAAVYRGRDRWLEGARNVPTVAVPFPVAKGKPALWRSVSQPSPATVMASFKNQWIRAGQESCPVPGLDPGRIYSLFLEPEFGAQASGLLDRYVGLTVPLLIGLSRALTGGPDLVKSAREEALIAIAVYGILLARLGRSKEIYMESRDYLLGQFLQRADLLHRLYCVHERKGSIPPQLIGNAAISMALQSPRRALEVLCARMPVYLAWADRYDREEAGLAKWSRKELGRLSTALKDENLDSRVSANGKAELLLGYLANTKQSEKQESSL